MNEEMIINDLLKEIIKNSHKCAHCKYFHQEDDYYCFFAYACLTADFHFFDEED